MSRTIVDPRTAAPVLLLALSGCAGVAPTSTGQDAPPEGRWELVGSNFVESGRIPGVPRATLDIAGGRLAAYSGCNRGSGLVRAVDGRLAVEHLQMAHRRCPEPVGSFDARYFKLLTATPVYHVEGRTLRLVAGDYNARFRKR